MASKTIMPLSLRQTSSALTRRQCRTFTSTCRASAMTGGAINSSAMRNALMKQMQKQKDLTSQMKRLKRGEIPDDLGFLPGTLIRPASKDMPSIFSGRWKRRLRIEWAAIRQSILDFGRMVYMYKWSVKRDPLTNKWVYKPLALSPRARTVQNLHHELYTSFAAGDRTAVERISCTGLKRELQIKLDRRRASQKPNQTLAITYRPTAAAARMPWLTQTLIPPQLRAVRIVADRLTVIPLSKDSTLRQVVARVKSRQMLDRMDGQGPRTEDKMEYVVMQKLEIDGEEDDWKIWGTVKASSEREIDEILEGKHQGGEAQQGFFDRLKEKMMGIGGGGGMSSNV